MTGIEEFGEDRCTHYLFGLFLCAFCSLPSALPFDKQTLPIRRLLRINDRDALGVV